MGDLVSRGAKAAQTIEEEEAERQAARMQKGRFEREDRAKQLQQLRKRGGMSGVMNLLPGVGKIKQQMANANIDETVIKRQEAIIGSMTREERKNPKVIHASRKKRIAAGSGTSVQDVNKLLKQHQIGRAHV